MVLTLLYGGHTNGDGVGTVADGSLKTEEVGLMVCNEAVCMATLVSSVPSLVLNLTLDVCEIANCSDVIVSEQVSTGGSEICETIALRNGWVV